MFSDCINLTKVYFGKVNFLNCVCFDSMFFNCRKLMQFNSNFDTKNALSFNKMFLNCLELSKINVKNFNLIKCGSIKEMFSFCKNLKKIDLLNWDMSNLERSKGGIDLLFYKCTSLKKIKMATNFSNVSDLCDEGFFSGKRNTFGGMPKNGLFVWKKTINCEPIFKLLPELWDRKQI